MAQGAFVEENKSKSIAQLQQELAEGKISTNQFVLGLSNSLQQQQQKQAALRQNQRAEEERKRRLSEQQALEGGDDGGWGISRPEPEPGNLNLPEGFVNAIPGIVGGAFGTAVGGPIGGMIGRGVLGSMTDPDKNFVQAALPLGLGNLISPPDQPKEVEEVPEATPPATRVAPSTAPQATTVAPTTAPTAPAQQPPARPAPVPSQQPPARPHTVSAPQPPARPGPQTQNQFESPPQNDPVVPDFLQNATPSPVGPTENPHQGLTSTRQRGRSSRSMPGPSEFEPRQTNVPTPPARPSDIDVSSRNDLNDLTLSGYGDSLTTEFQPNYIGNDPKFGGGLGMNQNVSSFLQDIANDVGSFTVTSGRRTADYNRAQGGVPSSSHITGRAADIRDWDITPDQQRQIMQTAIDARFYVQHGNPELKDVGRYIPKYTHIHIEAPENFHYASRNHPLPTPAPHSQAAATLTEQALDEVNREREEANAATGLIAPTMDSEPVGSSQFQTNQSEPEGLNLSPTSVWDEAPELDSAGLQAQMADSGIEVTSVPSTTISLSDINGISEPAETPDEEEDEDEEEEDTDSDSDTDGDSETDNDSGTDSDSGTEGDSETDNDTDSSTGFAEGGFVTPEDLPKDPVSGNKVPPNSTPKNVRDDVPAMLSEGEYVIPANVVETMGGPEYFDNIVRKANEASGFAGFKR